jgi:hypothetical protein
MGDEFFKRLLCKEKFRPFIWSMENSAILVTLALGLQPRQRVYKVADQEEAQESRQRGRKGAGQKEARESHHILSRM